MKNAIQILLAQDDKAEVELIGHSLRRGGLAFTMHRAENEVSFRRQLQRRSADVILSGHGFAWPDGFKALELARKYCPEVPFIFLAPTHGEDLNNIPFRGGANDYLFKHPLSQLPLTIERALQEVDNRAARRQLEQDRELLIKELEESLLESKPRNILPLICALQATPPPPPYPAIHR